LNKSSRNKQGFFRRTAKKLPLKLIILKVRFPTATIKNFPASNKNYIIIILSTINHGKRAKIIIELDQKRDPEKNEKERLCTSDD